MSPPTLILLKSNPIAVILWLNNTIFIINIVFNVLRQLLNGYN